MVVIGNDTTATAFTGGLDFEYQRWSRTGHEGAEGWHDVVAKVDGPAVQALYDCFRQVWNENLSRKPRRFRFDGERMPSYLDGASPLRLAPFPQPRREAIGYRASALFRSSITDPTTVSPRTRRCPSHRRGFSSTALLCKRLLLLQTPTSTWKTRHWSQEILSWVNQALRDNAELRVILLFSGRADPNDPGFSDAPYLTQSINNGLLLGLTEAQRARVRLFRQAASEQPVLSRRGPTSLPPM